jgi:hypothetical protein
MDSGCAPKRIGLCQGANNISDLTTDRWPPGAFATGLELPEQLETLSMPPNDRFGFEDDQWLPPVSPESGKQDPEETIPVAKFRSFGRTSHNGQLLAKRKVFQSWCEAFSDLKRILKMGFISVFIMNGDVVRLTPKKPIIPKRTDFYEGQR